MRFEIEAKISTSNELGQQLLSEIVKYEEISKHSKASNFIKKKLLTQIEKGLKMCSKEPEAGQYGVINYLQIERAAGAWYNFWSQETATDDYILFRGYGSPQIFLIAQDPTFSHHTSKGYVKQSKIYITLAVIELRDNQNHYLTLYHFSNNTKSKNKDETHRRCHVLPMHLNAQSQDQKSSYQPSLTLFPFTSGDKQFKYKHFPQRWFIQSANSENTICWLKRSVFLSRYDGPLEGVQSINRPIAVSTSKQFIVIYPCRFGDLVNLLYSKESYYLRYWIKENPLQILELIRSILEPIANIHKHRADIKRYTIARGKKLYKNISWPPFIKYIAQNKVEHLVHTDIKLDNFLFQPDIIYNFESDTTSTSFTFKIEITDFDGLACEGQQMQGNATPGYISPQMEESYLKGKCYHVNQLDDAFSSGEMLSRIGKVLIPPDHPNHTQIYTRFLEPIILKLKEFEPSKRMYVTDAYNKICKYIVNFKSSNHTNMGTKFYHPQTPKVENQNYDQNTFLNSLNKSDKLELHHLPPKSCINNDREITESTECVSSLYRKSPNLSHQETTDTTSTFDSDDSEINAHTLIHKDIPDSNTNTCVCGNLTDKYTSCTKA